MKQQGSTLIVGCLLATIFAFIALNALEQSYVDKQLSTNLAHSWHINNQQQLAVQAARQYINTLNWSQIQQQYGSPNNDCRLIHLGTSLVKYCLTVMMVEPKTQKALLQVTIQLKKKTQKSAQFFIFFNNSDTTNS